MNVYKRFNELLDQVKPNEAVTVEDATHGTIFDNIEDLPVWFAEQPAEYAYFRIVDKGAKSADSN